MKLQFPSSLFLAIIWSPFMASAVDYGILGCGNAGKCIEGDVAVDDKTEPYAVRCCAATMLSNKFKDASSATCGTLYVTGKDTTGSCMLAKTFVEAEQACAAHGATLCTLEEYNLDCTKKAGCGQGKSLCWSSTEFIEPSVTPSMVPLTDEPSSTPSIPLTDEPTSTPSLVFSSEPTMVFSSEPTMVFSSEPTMVFSSEPTIVFSSEPTISSVVSGGGGCTTADELALLEASMQTSLDNIISDFESKFAQLQALVDDLSCYFP